RPVRSRFAPSRKPPRVVDFDALRSVLYYRKDHAALTIVAPHAGEEHTSRLIRRTVDRRRDDVPNTECRTRFASTVGKDYASRTMDHDRTCTVEPVRPPPCDPSNPKNITRVALNRNARVHRKGATVRNNSWSPGSVLPVPEEPVSACWKLIWAEKTSEAERKEVDFVHVVRTNHPRDVEVPHEVQNILLALHDDLTSDRSRSAYEPQIKSV